MKDIPGGGILPGKRGNSFRGDPPIRLGVLVPTMMQRSQKLYHLSKPPSVSQHRAITRMRFSCPTRNLTARKPCVLVLATFTLSFVVFWTITWLQATS